MNAPSGDGSEPLIDFLSQAARRVLSRGRREVERAAARGRERLELRQLERDRVAFWARLGRTAYRLVEQGEIDHPLIRKGMARIDELDERIEALGGHPVDEGD